MAHSLRSSSNLLIILDGWFFIQYFLTLNIRMCYLDNQSPLSLTTPTSSNHAGDVLHIIIPQGAPYTAILAPMAYDTSFITIQGAAETDYSYTGCHRHRRPFLLNLRDPT